jgi:hypothetical protein
MYAHQIVTYLGNTQTQLCIEHNSCLPLGWKEIGGNQTRRLSWSSNSTPQSEDGEQDHTALQKLREAILGSLSGMPRREEGSPELLGSFSVLVTEPGTAHHIIEFSQSLPRQEA